MDLQAAMSQSPRSPSSTGERTHANSSILNAEVTPFTPYSPKLSTLRPSAPIFVTPVAIPATPNPPTEPPANCPDVQPFNGFLDGNKYSTNLAEVLQKDNDNDIATVDFCAVDGSVNFGDLGLGMDLLRDTSSIDNDFVTQQPGYTDDILPVEQAGAIQWTGEAHVLGEPGILPSIEDSFDLSPLNRVGGLDAESSDDIDGDYETDDEYVPHTAGSAEDFENFMVPYPTPEWSWNSPQSTDDDNVGTIRSTHTKTSRSNNDGKATPNCNQRNAREKSPVTNANIKKPTKARPLAEKFKQANMIIAQQKTNTSLARRLGEDVRVIQTNGRVSIEGVYWKAPRNDFTIPATSASQKECVRTIIAALVNNQDCKEVATSQAFLNRWADGADYFTIEELETVAWEVVASHSHELAHRSLLAN
jgi:hypothetical protein